MPQFSIIIPVYKVVAYLDRCVNSVLSQSFTDFELILVDDGSPDECPALCDLWSQKDNRITVIHKENGGLSSARTAGLDADKGNYILFVDSDDYWENRKALEILNERIEKYSEDIILYSCRTQYQNGSMFLSRGNYDLSLLNLHDKAETLRYLNDNNLFPGAAWIMATKLELIRNEHLLFPIGVTAEDYLWIFSLLYACNTIGAVNGLWYVYVKREGSITTKSSVEGVKGISMAVNYCLDKTIKDNPVTYQMNLRMADVYLLELYGFVNLDKQNRKELKKVVNNDAKILRKASRYFIFITVRILGISLVGKMVAVGINWKQKMKRKATR